MEQVLRPETCVLNSFTSLYILLHTRLQRTKVSLYFLAMIDASVQYVKYHATTGAMGLHLKKRLQYADLRV